MNNALYWVRIETQFKFRTLPHNPHKDEQCLVLSKDWNVFVSPPTGIDYNDEQCLVLSKDWNIDYNAANPAISVADEQCLVLSKDWNINLYNQ